MAKPFMDWHVLYVKSQHEKKINKSLIESGFESFLPTTTVVRQWSDRKKKIIKPLFPSYIFIRISSKQDFYNALKIKGIYNYIRFGSRYATLKNDEIEKIKYFLNLDGITEINTTLSVPKKGELMRINYGSLYGLDCEVLKTNNKNKVFVRIDSLGRNITAVVPNKFLSPTLMVSR